MFQSYGLGCGALWQNEFSEVVSHSANNLLSLETYVIMKAKIKISAESPDHWKGGYENV